MRARIARIALTNVHAYKFFHACLQKFPIKERAFLRLREWKTSRENTAPRAITPLSLRGPSISTRNPRSAKSPFSLPTHVRARAHAPPTKTTTHRRRVHARTGEPSSPSSPSSQNPERRGRPRRTEESITREAVHSAPSPGSRRSRE